MVPVTIFIFAMQNIIGFSFDFAMKCDMFCVMQNSDLSNQELLGHVDLNKCFLFQCTFVISIRYSCAERCPAKGYNWTQGHVKAQHLLDAAPFR